MGEIDTGRRSDALCEACGKLVDPRDPAVIRAVTMTVETMGMAEWMDGMGVYFHDDCFPYGSSDYTIVAD